MASDRRIKVLIVDDHGMVRRGIRTYLITYDDLEIVGEARDGREAVFRCEREQPDVILMDLMMPGMNGVEATCAIQERWPQIQVIALTSFEEKELVQDALQAGAISYLLKNVAGDELAAAIRAADVGRATLAREAVQALISAKATPSPLREPLTPREQEVLALLTEGLTNPEIAVELNISRSTAKVHVSNILSKMGVSNRAEAIVMALEHKLVG